MTDQETRTHLRDLLIAQLAALTAIRTAHRWTPTDFTALVRVLEATGAAIEVFSARDRVDVDH